MDITAIKHALKAVAIGAAAGGLEAADTINFGTFVSPDLAPTVSGVAATILAYLIQRVQEAEKKETP